MIDFNDHLVGFALRRPKPKPCDHQAVQIFDGQLGYRTCGRCGARLPPPAPTSWELAELVRLARAAVGA